MEVKCPYHGAKYMKLDGYDYELEISTYQCDVCGFTIRQCKLPHMETELLK